jgi:hypothetical protein
MHVIKYIVSQLFLTWMVDGERMSGCAYYFFYSSQQVQEGSKLTPTAQCIAPHFFSLSIAPP